MRKEDIISQIILKYGITQFGFTDFEEIQNKLIPCSKFKAIPQNAKTIFSFLFPYYAGEFNNSNISKYAIAPDYHSIIINKLKEVAQLLKERFVGFEFVPFCDNSPIPEVYTAALAGLGHIGKNGLLIHLKYGSFVFIGEIITDLQIEKSVASIRSCDDCGICIKNCPSGALTQNRFEKSKCLSFITQKKDGLTIKEKELIRKTGCIWGCDICQNVCPLNRKIAKTEIFELKNNLKPLITQDELEDLEFETKNTDRAYLWKGKEVLKRNLCIINASKDDNKNGLQKI